MTSPAWVKHSAINLLFLALTLSASAEDWPQWRGPHFNGSSNATNLPDSLDPAKNLLWSVDMAGESPASPVIAGDKVFVVSSGDEHTKLFGMCVDLNTGAVLWNKLLDESSGPIPRNTWASCSPVADENSVYFTFGTGLVVAFDHGGTELWRRDLTEIGRIGLQFGYASTPMLLNGKLYFPILCGQWRTDVAFDNYHDGDSFLLCLNAETGETVFHHHRPSDAVGESYDSYNSAVPYRDGDQTIIVIQGGDYTTGHDPETGEELWRFADNLSKEKNWRLIPTPVIMDELIFNAQPRGGLAYAFNPKKPEQKDINSAEWLFDSRTTDVPTPAFYKAKLYVLNGVQKTVTCFDPKTGAVEWEADVPDTRRIWASPAVADDKIVLMGEDGGVVLASIADGFHVLSSISLGGMNSKSTAALTDGKIILRTTDKLYCFGS